MHVLNWMWPLPGPVSTGVNYRGRGGGTGPPEFGVGDADANCPSDFVMFQNFKNQIACITMQGEVTDKNTSQNSPNHAISSEKEGLEKGDGHSA